MSGDQNEAARGAASFVRELPREIASTAAAEIDVDKGDLRAQLDHAPDRFRTRCGDPDDGHPFLLEQGAGCLLEAHAVVNDQAAQSYRRQHASLTPSGALQLAAIPAAPAAPHRSEDLRVLAADGDHLAGEVGGVVTG